METEIPHILKTSRPLQCVPYTRALTGLPIQGDAWTWWPAAEGHYLRSHQPRTGSVLVLRRTDRLRYGHLAVVTRVINSRRVLVDHANWLNRGDIHRYAPVIDVSPANDWSAVRVWYIPGNKLGARTYPAYGFIHPARIAAVPGAPT
jgi:surface antigen